MSDLVSVIIPVHNGQAELNRAIDSVLGQTHGDFELIVVDDGSTDDSLDVVGRYADDRVHLIARPVGSGGPSEPRNLGMKAAAGEWIALLDQDDEWLPTKLELQLGNVADETALVYARTLIDRPGEERFDYHARWRRQPHDGLCPHELIRHNFVTTLTTMVRRTWAERIGEFDDRLNGIEDHDYWLRVAMSGGSFVFVDEVTAVHYYHDTNLSSRIDRHRLKAQMFSMLAREYPEYRADLRRQVWPARKRHFRQQAWRAKRRWLRH